MTRPLELSFGTSGRFEVVRRLGEGGMGVVYEAFDRERRARVALKTLRTLSAEGILRFKNEFRALQDLNHPNLCGLGELICESGQWFFTMELIQGIDLLTWVRPGGRSAPVLMRLDVDGEDVTEAAPLANDIAQTEYAPTDAQQRQWLNQSTLHDVNAPSYSDDTLRAARTQARIERLERASPPALDVPRLRAALLGLGRGVSTLHAAGVVHRDIKPPNILVDGNGRVVLLDFGLATSSARPGESDVRVVGTADYMAPEQASGRKVGPQADWYSVGVVLYEALTGGVPFAGAPLEVMLQKQGREPLPPRALAAETPPDLDSLCVGLLRRDPRERFGAREVNSYLGRHASVEISLTPPREASFVGRDEELAVLEASFERARAGNSVTVHVRGESGVGKSALVRHFVGKLRAAEPQLMVLHGRCYERESVPYKAVDGVIDVLSRLLNKLPKAEVEQIVPPRAGLLAEAFPVLRRVEAVAQAPRTSEAVDPMLLRRRLFTALRELLNNLAARAPLVVIIDDLQWADADSLALLEAVTRPPAAPPFLLLATVRVAGEEPPAERSPPRLQPEARIVHLARLSPSEARTLAAELLRQAAEPHDRGDGARLAQAIADEARGHPLFIDELVRHASASRQERATPMHVEDALWERFERLDPAAQRVLELVAIAGGPLVQQAAARAAEMEFGQFAQSANTLRAANLVRTTGARASDLIEPYHDRVRAAIQSHRTPAEMRRAHERLALGLEATGRADPEQLAAHWRGAGQNDKAATYTVQAAERASKALAFDRAAQLYRQTLLLYPAGSAEVPKLQMRLGDALAFTGRGAEAARAYLAAAERAEPSDAIELRRRASEQLLRSGHVDDGMAALAPVLDANRLRVPSTSQGALTSLLYRRARVRLRGLRFRRRDAAAVPPELLARIDTAWSVAVGLGNVDTLRASDFAARQLLLALDAGEPSRVARALALEACFWAVQGSVGAERAAELMGVARALAEEIDSPHAIGLTIAAGAIVKHMAGQWRDAIALFAEAEQLFRERCRAVNWELATSQIFRLHGVVQLGEMSELAKAATEYLQEAEQRGDLYAATMFRLGQLNLMWLAEDLPSEARQECDDAIARWSNRDFHTQHADYHWALAQIDLYGGDGEGAYRRMREIWPKLERTHQLRLQVSFIGHHDLRGRSAIAAAAKKARGGERDRLLADALASAKEIERQESSWARGLAAVVRAGAANVAGDKERAAEMLASAVERFYEADMAMHAAVARGRRGQLLGGDEGSVLVGAMKKWCEGQHVRNPTRFSDVLAPGFGDG